MLCILGLKQQLPCQCKHKSSFHEQTKKNSPDIIIF